MIEQSVEDLLLLDKVFLAEMVNELRTALEIRDKALIILREQNEEILRILDNRRRKLDG